MAQIIKLTIFPTETIENLKRGSDTCINIDADSIRQIEDIISEEDKDVFLYSTITMVNGTTFDVEESREEIVELINKK